MKIPESVTQAFSKQMLNLKRNSPHIYFVGGVIGVISTTVLACRATLKLSDTLEEIEKEVDAVQHKTESEPNRKEVALVYTKATLQVGRLYAPSVILGAVSIGALATSHIQLSRRNTALMAAYATLQKAYDEYRERVREVVGEEKELDLYLGTETKSIVDDDGKKKEIKSIRDPNKLSPYARIFDESSQYWEKDPELNRLYVCCQQNYFNQLLRARGHVFLNEVYDMLGFDRTPAGAVVGWLIDQDGDNYVSFGLYESGNERFMNGWERSIILDFNVNGVIYDRIGRNVHYELPS